MKKKTLMIFFVGHLALSLLLTGCFNFNKSFPEKRFFVLNASRSEGFSASKSDAVLRIRRFRVSPRFEGKGFVYRKGNLNYASDFYNEFFISPALMIAEEVDKWLKGSGLFKYVMSSSSPFEPTVELEGVISALYGDYRDTKAPKAVLEMQFFLVRNVSSQPVIVFGKTYHEEILIKGNSPDDLVASWNLAIEHILSKLETNLKDPDLNEGISFPLG
jgi:cholesterol transport system auxiliary component